MKTTNLIYSLLLVVFLSSCEQEIEKEILVQNVFEAINSDVIVSSEGNFGAKDGSVSYFGEDNVDVFHYEETNGVKLGGLVQSIAFGEDNAYVVLNDVNQIVVVDKTTFEKVASIETGLQNPRYMAIVGDNAYVTNWGAGSDATDDYIAVIDLNTNTVTSEIAVKEGPEQIIANDTNLYVSHLGGWSSNNIVSVIAINTNTVTSEITVDDNPDEIVFDSEGDLIVLSQGNTTYDENWNVTGVSQSSIQFISTVDHTIEKTLDFPENQSGTLLSYDNNKIYYYTSDSVYAIDESATSLSDESIFTGNLFGMNVKSGKVFTLSFAFTNLSKLSVIDEETKNVDYETAVGLGASKVYFLE